MELKTKIEETIKSKPVVVYMKGSKDFPRCGFSANAINVLRMAGAQDSDIATVDVLEDESIRTAIKSYSNWPTIPQIYIKGQFIGGSDIVTDLYESGELSKLVAQAKL
jgi:monothiol glutaredoxin